MLSGNYNWGSEIRGLVLIGSTEQRQLDRGKEDNNFKVETKEGTRFRPALRLRRVVRWRPMGIAVCLVETVASRARNLHHYQSSFPNDTKARLRLLSQLS